MKETLSLDSDQLAGLFQRKFGPGPKDNFQRSMTWLCFRGALSVQNKLARLGARVPNTFQPARGTVKLSCTRLYGV